MKSKHYFFLILFVLLIPNGLFAAEFQALVGIPGLTDMTGPGSLNQYINALYRLSISIAALLAVIKIVAAGAKYMLSDIITHKEEAKKDIQGALIGLLIVIGAIVILNTINSDLTNLNLAVPVQQITQGEALENALFDAVTADCDKPGRSSQCKKLTCENLIGVNNFEVRADEDEITACKRTCIQDYRGAFDPKLYDPASATCQYDPLIAQKCDPNNSWNCCVDIKKSSWDKTTRTCTGVTQATAQRKLSCGIEGKVWNDQSTYCTTATCNINTDTNCCSAKGGSINNATCNLSSTAPVPGQTPINSNTLTEIENRLTDLPSTVRSSVLTRIQDNLAGTVITDTIQNNEIIQSQGAGGMVVAAILPPNQGDGMALVVNTVEGICNDVGLARTGREVGVVEGTLGGNRYIACVSE